MSGVSKRPKNIRIHLAYPMFAFICNVSIHLEISAAECDLCQGNSLSESARELTSPIFALATLTRGRGPYASR